MTTQKSISNDTKLKEFLLDFISGGVAGAFAKTVSAPAERVKLLLQTQDTNHRIKVKYTGVINCFVRSYREDGLLAFWKGNFVNVIRYFPTQALNFAFKDFFHTIFNPFDAKVNPTKFFIGNMLSGGMAGSTTTLFVYPLDFVRTRLGVDAGKAVNQEFSGIIDCMLKVVKKDGIFGLYRGINLAFFGIFLYRGLYFGFYDSGKELLFNDHASLAWYQKFFYAQSCVIGAELFSYPTDTVKRKLMMQSGKEQKEFTGVFDCFKKVYQTGGLVSFWRGYSSNIFRSIGSSLCLVLYDWIKKERKALI